MSADQWEVCPRCLDRAKAERAAQHQAALASYGKVSANEYERLITAAAQVDVDPMSFLTFREDYEFSGADEGTIMAAYSGECQTCGLAVRFTHEHEFYEVEAER